MNLQAFRLKLAYNAPSPTHDAQRGSELIISLLVLEVFCIALQTKATIGGVPPFSLMCLSHSHEWLCTLRMKMV